MILCTNCLLKCNADEGQSLYFTLLGIDTDVLERVAEDVSSHNQAIVEFLVVSSAAWNSFDTWIVAREGGYCLIWSLTIALHLHQGAEREDGAIFNYQCSFKSILTNNLAYGYNLKEQPGIPHAVL